MNESLFMTGTSPALEDHDTGRRVLHRRLYTTITQFDIWTTHVVGAFADTTRDLGARDFHPFLNRQYPPKGKQEKPLATLTCLCRFVYRRRARYGFTVLPFSSEVGVQTTQTLIRGDDDQETDQNTFHRCQFLECRQHYPKSLPRRPQTPLS